MCTLIKYVKFIPYFMFKRRERFWNKNKTFWKTVKIAMYV